MENDLSSPRAHRGALAILILSWIIGGLWFFSGRRADSVREYHQLHACGALAAPNPIPYDPRALELSALERDFSLISMKLEVKAVYDTAKAWPWKRLSVWFMEKDLPAGLAARILQTARIWTKGTGVVLDLASAIDHSDIRIAIRDPKNRYASWVGMDATQHPQDPTMWLYEIDKVGPDTFTRVVLHEFGHALGLYHELQNPENNLELDTSEVYRYFSEEYQWSEATVDEQIFHKLHGSEHTAFDPNSIMIYGIPARLTKKKDRSIPWPRWPSSKDIEQIQKFYPKTK